MQTQEMLKHHFEDDKLAFHKIDEAFERLDKQDKNFEKRLDRFEELMKISGQHFSDFRLEQGKTNESVGELKDLMVKHIDRVEPMLLSYETKKSVFKWARGWGGNVMFFAGIVTSITVIGGGVIWFVRLIIKNL